MNNKTNTAAHIIEDTAAAAAALDRLIGDRRRGCVIILNATAGNVRAARGIVSKAIAAALGRTAAHTAPHFVTYCAANSEGSCSGDPCYRLDVTDDEREQIEAAAARIAAAAGWDRAPIDTYHD